MELEAIIGLEIHCQLKTKSKMFCACDNTGEDKPANTTICPICMGHPGTLPVPNAEAVKQAIKAALALNLHVNLFSKFDRKNYFYPDLPKGYQISQYDEPIAEEGYLLVETRAGQYKFGIQRLHMEEDTAKIIHTSTKAQLDFNRAGTPLIEIVTKPEVTTPEVAKAFLQELRLTLRYLGVSEADMEKGHLRCDANISMRPKGESKLYPKTEVKNLNSFRSVEKALSFEINRQSALWQAGTPPTNSPTVGWDEKSQTTVMQREKETIHDYRYFPEPDLPPLILKQEQVDAIAVELPELPAARREFYMKEYGLSAPEARFLTEDIVLGELTKKVVNILVAEFDGDIKATAKLAVNWIAHKLTPMLIDKDLTADKLPFNENDLAEFLLLVARRQVNSTNAQVLLSYMLNTGKNPQELLSQHDLQQADGETDWTDAIEKVINKNPDQVAQFKAGKEPVIKFILGALMRETKGKIDPIEGERLLRDKLQD